MLRQVITPEKNGLQELYLPVYLKHKRIYSSSEKSKKAGQDAFDLSRQATAEVADISHLSTNLSKNSIAF
jgi:hypothetical protein